MLRDMPCLGLHTQHKPEGWSRNTCDVGTWVSTFVMLACTKQSLENTVGCRGLGWGLARIHREDLPGTPNVCLPGICSGPWHAVSLLRPSWKDTQDARRSTGALGGQ